MHSSPNIIRVTKSRRVRQAGHVTHKRDHEGKKPLRRPMYKWEDNIKIYLTQSEGVYWIYLTQNRKQWQTLVKLISKKGWEFV
jgi:hypothetical protein